MRGNFFNFIEKICKICNTSSAFSQGEWISFLQGIIHIKGYLKKIKKKIAEGCAKFWEEFSCFYSKNV